MVSMVLLAVALVALIAGAVGVLSESRQGARCVAVLFVPTGRFYAIVACVIAFGLGRLVGLWRRVGDRAEATPSEVAVGAIFTDSALIAFYFVVTTLLAYDAFAEFQPVQAWPLTYYLRCGITASPWGAVASATAVSFLMGHWLWYPVRSPK